MLGHTFLKEIDVEDADCILEALKKYGNEDLIDKWVSVKMIATEARKIPIAERAGYTNPTDRPPNLYWDLDKDWRVDENGNPYEDEIDSPEN